MWLQWSHRKIYLVICGQLAVNRNRKQVSKVSYLWLHLTQLFWLTFEPIDIPTTPQPASSSANAGALATTPSSSNVTAPQHSTPSGNGELSSIWNRTVANRINYSTKVLPSNDTLVFAGDSTALINESPSTLYEVNSAVQMKTILNLTMTLQMSEKIEQDVAKSLITYNRCIKEMSEITVDSDKYVGSSNSCIFKCLTSISKQRNGNHTTH